MSHVFVPGSPEPPPAARRWWLADAAIALLCAAFWSFVGIRLYDRFATGMDLAIFDQAVRSLAHFHAPVSSMKTVGMNLWGDHFHPVLVLAVPFYWIWADPRMLVIVQALCFGLGAAIIASFARRRLGARWGVLCGLAFACCLGVQAAAVFDFHEVSLGVPLLAWALVSWSDGRWNRATALLLLFLLVKEDTPVIVGGAALGFLLQRRWRRGLLLGAVAGAWLLLTTKVIIPALAPNHQWAYAGRVALSPATVGRNLFHALLWHAPLTLTILVLVAASGLAAVRSPLVWPALTAFGSRAIVDMPGYWGFGFHYNLLPCVVLAVASIDGLCRVPRRRGRAWRRAAAVTMVVVGLAGLWRGQIHTSLTKGSGVRAADAQRAIDAVPAGAPVAADVYLTAHLTPHHTVVQQLRPPDWVDDLGHPVLATVDWVVVDHDSFGYKDQPGWVDAATRELSRNGFRLVQTDGEFAVYRR